MADEHNLYAAPESDITPLSTDDDTQHFFPVSITKLWVMNMATLGSYLIYWFYKNWKLQMAQTGEKMRPFWRSLFYIFYTHEMFRRLEASAQKMRTVQPWQATTMANYVVILAVSNRILDRFASQMDFNIRLAMEVGGLLCLFPLFGIFATVQRTANRINGDSEGELNNRFSALNIVGIVFGCILWLGILLAMLMPAPEAL